MGLLRQMIAETHKYGRADEWEELNLGVWGTQFCHSAQSSHSPHYAVWGTQFCHSAQSSHSPHYAVWGTQFCHNAQSSHSPHYAVWGTQFCHSAQSPLCNLCHSSITVAAMWVSRYASSHNSVRPLRLFSSVNIRKVCLMFVPCIIRRNRNNQHHALDCATPLFNIQAPTCFSSSLPSSGSFLDPSELLEIQIELVVCHIMYVYVTCVLECCGSICCASQLRWLPSCAGKHIKWNHRSKKLPDDGRLLLKYVGACILNKRVVQFSA
jgi:hypothetical protein